MERVESCLVGSPNASCNFRNVSEIEEEEGRICSRISCLNTGNKEEFEITECSSSSYVFRNEDDNVYVAVAKSELSRDALRRTTLLLKRKEKKNANSGWPISDIKQVTGKRKSMNNKYYGFFFFLNIFGELSRA